MNIGKNCIDILSNIADNTSQKIVKAAENFAEKQETKEVQAHATELAGNYGKAIAHISSNTTSAQKAMSKVSDKLSELERIFSSLELKGKKIIQFSDCKDDLEVIFYKGKHNDYFKSPDGKIFRVRYSKDDELNKTLINVAEAYKARGFKVPNMMSVKIDGKRGVASQLVTDLQPKEFNKKEVYKIFATDVLFGARNAYSKGVTMLSQDGKVVKVTPSGSAGYRVRGERRTDFTEELTELRTFLDPNVNPESAEFLKDMTREDLLDSIQIATKPFINYDIPTHKILEKRKNNLKEFWMRAKLMPQNEGESLLDYVIRVQSKIEEVHQENLYFTEKLHEIVDSYKLDDKWDFGGFHEKDKEVVKQFVDLASTCNEIPKALYKRNFSRDEMLKLAKRQFEKDNNLYPYISIDDEPEILSKILYSPYKNVQTSIDDIIDFSNGYSSMRSFLSSGEPGSRIILDKGLLDKFYKGEISYKDFKYLGTISPENWSKFEQRKLFEPIAGMNKSVSGEIAKTLAEMSDDNYAKILSRPEILSDLQYRSKPLTSEFMYAISDLTDEQYQRVLKYHLLEDKYPGGYKNLFDKNDIKCLAEMTDEELELAISRGLLKHYDSLDSHVVLDYNSQLGGFEISQIVKMNDETFNNLIKRGLFSGKYDYFARRHLFEKAEFTDSELDLLNLYGIDYDKYGKDLSRQILELPNKSRIKELERLNIKEPTKKQTDENSNFLLGQTDLVNLAQLPEKNYQRAVNILKDKRLVNSVFKNGGIYQAAVCDDKTWQIIKERGLLDVDNPISAHMDDLLCGYIYSSLEKQFPNASSLTLLTKIPDDRWKLFLQKELISNNPDKGQLSASTLYEISQYSDEDLNKLLHTKIFEGKYDPAEHNNYTFSLHHSRLNLHFDDELRKLTIEEIDALAKRDFFKMFQKRNYPDYVYLNAEALKKAAYFSDEQFDVYKKLIELPESNPYSSLNAIINFNQVEIQRIFDRYLMEYSKYFEDMGNYHKRYNNLKQLVTLTDTEWKFVQPLMSRVFNLSEAINLGKGVAHLVEFVNGRKNLYDFSFRERRQLLNHLIHTGGVECGDLNSYVPQGTIIPKTMYRRNLLIDELTQNLGISSKKLSDVEILDFKNTLSKISQHDSGIMNTNFDLMSNKVAYPKQGPRLLYSREKFVNDIYTQIKDLSDIERKKVFDYFSFDIEKDNLGSLKLVGYPAPKGKDLKFFEYEDEKIKKIIEKIRPYVEKFSNGNKIFVENNPKLETEMNKILNVFPEFATLVGKVQHGTHDFSVDIHTLKVLQGVMSDPRYAKLSDNDKMVLQVSTILHDLTKTEGQIDKLHPKDSAFDAYYIINRLNMPRADKLKVYEIIRNHDWLEKLNKNYKIVNNEYHKITPEEYNDMLQKIAFSHRQNDCFEMSAILAKADLKGVKANDAFYSKFKDAYENKVKEVQVLINKIKETAIHIPQTRIPKASELIVDNDIVYKVTHDGVTNTVIYLKPGQDLSKIGFDKGVISDELNMIVHALDAEEQSTIFRALGIVDSDALLSASWVNYGKGNYKVFRKQGYILKVDSDDIHAGTYKDFGSGYKKDYDTLLKEYLFGTERSEIREYWSKAVKEKFGFDSETYKNFNESIKNKSFNQIKAENREVARKIQEIIDNMDVKSRAGGRNYNEWLISRPEIQGGFFWGKNYDSMNKVERESSVADVPLFIREYLAQHDLPLIFFGV